MKTILITGANGQLGRELLAMAPAYGSLEVVGVDRQQCDISDAASVSRCFGAVRPALVINAAAYTQVDRAESDVARAYAVNRGGARHLAQACADDGVPLLHVSTDYVYDGSKATPWHVGDVVAPLGVYGASKLAGEMAVREARLPHVILRTSWVFGEYGNNFVRTMLRLATVRDELRVVADQRGGPTWTGDLAAALLAVAQRHLDGGTVHWGTYHYAGQPATTWHGFAQTVVAEGFAAGLLPRLTPVRAIATSDFPTPAHRPANSVLDMAETQRHLHLPAPDWRVGLRQVLANWRRNGTRF
jgi:dTDP-4-dehydrorhamnose reductase